MTFRPSPNADAEKRIAAALIRPSVAGVVCLLGVLWSIRAECIDGNKLLELCTSSGGPTYYQDQAYCAGYLQSINDSLVTLELAGIVQQLTCVPKQVSLLQMRDVALQYISTRPEVRHATASSLVLAALKQAYPCTRR